MGIIFHPLLPLSLVFPSLRSLKIVTLPSLSLETGAPLPSVLLNLLKLTQESFRAGFLFYGRLLTTVCNLPSKACLNFLETRAIEVDIFSG